MKQRIFKKSSRSGGSGGNCVEWARDDQGVWVRDSKNPDGPQLHMTFAQWDSFVEASLSGGAHPWIESSLVGAVVAKDGVTLHFTPAEWDAFVAGARLGECLVPA